MSDQQLDLTVVIPSKDRRDRLLVCLAGLAPELRAAAAAGIETEIVVVLDGPQDESEAAVADLAASTDWHGLRLAVRTQEWAGAAAARNTGLDAARGRSVLFLDDDVQAQPGLLEAHVRAQRRAGDDGCVVLGRMVQRPTPGMAGRSLDEWWAEHYRRLEHRTPRWTDVYTGNLSVGRAAAVRLGGFDAALPYGEDAEFGYRLVRGGVPLVYESDAAVVVDNPKSPERQLRDLFHAGQAAVSIVAKHPEAIADLPVGRPSDGTVQLRVVRRLALAATSIPAVDRVVERVVVAWARSGVEFAHERVFTAVRSHRYWQGVRSAAPAARWRELDRPGLAVLMYHSVAPGRADRYTVPPRRLRRHLTVLRVLGRRVIDLEQAVAALQSGRPVPRRSVALTFDDGYVDNLDHAAPVLARKRAPATLFAVAGLIGRDNAWDRSAGTAPKPLLDRAQLRRLDAAGFRVQSHAMTHRDLTRLEQAELQHELRESRNVLEATLGREVRLLAYPYGAHDAAVEAAARDAGYTAAFAVHAGFNDVGTDRWAYRRIAIDGTDGAIRFGAKLLLGQAPFRRLLARARRR
ncbi:MAG: polysaccharide deacetylase family protein [Jatrophihabitans sp.]|uniref:polysaccharide deacetylase family protein n=1 Tax=Jatrophihabitans sp. TaxID=1932789 RepID=UPI003F7FF0FC